MSGQRPGSDLSSSPSPEDLEVARRRYHKFIEMSLAEPYTPPEELIDRLSDKGATVLSCGHTRFQHAMADGCAKV